METRAVFLAVIFVAYLILEVISYLLSGNEKHTKWLMLLIWGRSLIFSVPLMFTFLYILENTARHK